MTYEEKMAVLREFSDLQSEMANKARSYHCKGEIELSMQFDRASLAAVSARMLMHAALMAERIATVPKVPA